MSKASELRDFGDQELQERLDENIKELFQLRFDLATAQVANTSRVGLLKREVARIHTIMTERSASSEDK
ncbi:MULTISPECIES: 50S ribosomal protein L29 [Acidithrix]|uniref:Large ribosomal subunit protein uL29 n=1 Tax=Acidithrix ferrooxidans TaxID=1280514 RepID=A0A0D8HL43_9ACTN|nr:MULTISPECIES: 50S ribosomal protein L29 [Acidithrix]KJF18579.1 50S ribosomal protein L29 [Acidithrix ferrooxidans]CAG4932812.1 unnamed protein product [Acidithrix sp. C25]